jgi:uncharacterized membrane protein YagU involved in acid resistance
MDEKYERTQKTIDWSAAIWAGVIGGGVFMLLEMIMVPLFMPDGSPWAPPRMIAAIGMGKDVLPPPATFDITILMVAMVIHFILSIIFALILAAIVSRFELGLAIVIGAIFGLILYLINFYGFTAIFPWFEMARNWISIFAHIVFGAITAGTYKWLQKPKMVIG